MLALKIDIGVARREDISCLLSWRRDASAAPLAANKVRGGE